ncbi:MAG: hypothetical protein M3Z23_01405, partial [Acidobacteriota bacterium]|nr:hypothetical protein [Acidobacteriota bacterium]
MADEPPQETNSTLITPEQMQAAIESSGYLLEGRISSLLTQHAFFVEPNCFIPDPADNTKAIEIDVTGRYLEWVKQENRDSVCASVLVE